MDCLLKLISPNSEKVLLMFSRASLCTASLCCAVFVAGCGGASSVPSGGAPTAASSSHMTPNNCDQGKHIFIKPKPGSFDMPDRDGWSGKVGHPHMVFGSEDWIVTVSTINNFHASTPPSGKAILYMTTEDIGPHHRAQLPEWKRTRNDHERQSGLQKNLRAERLLSEAEQSVP